MSTYTPGQVPFGVADLPGFLNQELANLRLSIESAQQLLALDTLFVEPKRPREGNIVKADGTIWNPNSGAGVYIRLGGAWVKLGGGGGGASTTQTGEHWSGLIMTPIDKTYMLVLKAPHGGTITETTTKSTAGTCTANFSIDTVTITGGANSVSTIEQSVTRTAVFAAGTDIAMVVTANSACTDLAFTLKYTRTLL